MYLWVPFVIEILITVVLAKMNVEETNERIKKEQGIVSDCVTDEGQA
jgi:GPH family glycoside/pentoside/hexuronide:cation symporter